MKCYHDCSALNLSTCAFVEEVILGKEEVTFLCHSTNYTSTLVGSNTVICRTTHSSTIYWRHFQSTKNIREAVKINTWSNLGHYPNRVGGCLSILICASTLKNYILRILWIMQYSNTNLVIFPLCVST
jgi:hypothetical protein